MGKIYKDIVENNSSTDIQDLIDSLNKVTYVFSGRDDILFRDNEIDRIYNIMHKNGYRSVLLVGDKGCGKVSIIEGYIQRLTKELSNEIVMTVDYDEILKTISGTNEFTKIIGDIIYAAEQTDYNIILNINNLGHLLNQNCYGNGGYLLFNNITKAIKDSNIRVIATTTNDEYKQIEENFQYLLDNFTTIKLTELTQEQSAEILKNEIDDYGEQFNLKLPEGIENIICKCADKYIKDKPFPLKGELLLDEVCASISSKKSVNTKIQNLNAKINELKLDLAESLQNNNYVQCEEINKKIEKLNKSIDKYKSKQEIINVSEHDILEAIGSIVGVKMSKLSKNQTEFLKEMPIELKNNVIGQDETIDIIVKNIRRNQLGLRKSSHSAGNFMFIGSTGVGKTYLAKQLAKYLYGSEENFLRLDMSEFQSEIDVSKLLGSAPGYVGYKESGLLVKGLAKKPETVVLFDEIEKAHIKIFDTLLQLLDEGFITGSDGKKVDASKALIIFTSNIGVREAKELSSPFGFSIDPEAKKTEKQEKIIRNALKKRFSPEFLNRLDNVCYFNALNRETLSSILDKELAESNTRISAITGKTVKLTKDVKNWILDKVEKEDNGARPIIRLLQQEIEEELSNLIVENDDILNTSQKYITASLQNEKIILK